MCLRVLLKIHQLPSRCPSARHLIPICVSSSSKFCTSKESAVVVLGGSQMICFFSSNIRWRKGKIKETDGILVAAETKWHETLHSDGWQLAHFSNWMDADDLKCLMPLLNVPPCRRCFLSVQKEDMAGSLGHDKLVLGLPSCYPEQTCLQPLPRETSGEASGPDAWTTSAGFSWRGWAEVLLWASPGCLSICEVSQSSRLQYV